MRMFLDEAPPDIDGLGILCPQSFVEAQRFQATFFFQLLGAELIGSAFLIREGGPADAHEGADAVGGFLGLRKVLGGHFGFDEWPYVDTPSTRTMPASSTRNQSFR